ncbi:MAG TPA: HD domain-containing phosphohydrolase, partial [bacterium]|nr:HD domain-containing phosphohydrolase [bacterium]
RGEEIPLGARIVAVCDAFHAMTSDRPYRPALSYEVAARELLHRSGDMWDPEIVRVHLGIVYPEALGAREEAALVLAA